MRATRNGMFTQEELSRLSDRKMKYHHVMFYETPERNIHAISKTQKEGFHLLAFGTGPHPSVGLKVVEIKNKEQPIEYSPYLQIAETKS